jgi:hypothetical protein
VHVTFGPVLDVNSNPANPIINTRAFGEDPALVSRLARAYIRGAREGGLLTTGKHFPGHGDTESDSHLGLPAIRADRARLDAVELPPYRAAVDAGVDGMMTAHIAVTGVLGPDAPPATLSPYFMTDVLRGEMGFGGVLFTDALDMGGVISRYGDADAAVLAVLAGADVLLMPRDVHAAIEAVVAAVRAGTLDEARIDASVRRILEAKARAGLPQSRFVPLDSVDRVADQRKRAAHPRHHLRGGERSRGGAGLRGGARIARSRGADGAGGCADYGGGVHRPARRRGLGGRGGARRLRGAAGARRDHLRARRSGGVRGAAGRGGPAGGPGLIRQPYLLDAFPDADAYLLAWGGMDVSQQAAAHALLGRIGITGTLPVSLPPFHAAGEGLRREGAGNRE